jgi:hypothetical protein
MEKGRSLFINPKSHHSDLPTATEIARIKSTIEILKKSESLLQQRINQEDLNNCYCEIRKENRHHAIEINAGWRQLSRMIDELPNSYIDKCFYAQEVEDGLRRSNLLINRTWIIITFHR